MSYFGDDCYNIKCNVILTICVYVYVLIVGTGQCDLSTR